MPARIDSVMILRRHPHAISSGSITLETLQESLQRAPPTPDTQLSIHTYNLFEKSRESCGFPSGRGISVECWEGWGTLPIFLSPR